MGPRVVALPLGIRLLGWLLVLGMLPFLGFVPLMPKALQLHFMRCLKLGQVFGVTGWRLVIVKLVLHADTQKLSQADGSEVQT